MHARSTGHLRQGLPCVFENGGTGQNGDRFIGTFFDILTV